MNFTIVFLLVLLGILLPAHIFRWVYFSSEHRHQVGSFKDIAAATANNILPGTLFLILSSFTYSVCIEPIDLGRIIDLSKDWWAPNFRFRDNDDYTLSQIVISQFGPFLLMQYGYGFALGFILRSFVRFTSLDVRLSGLEYRNKWSYLFDSTLYRGAENKVLREMRPDETLVVVNVDLKMLEGDEVKLYSGVFTDYILQDENPRKLEQLILSNTRVRKDGKAKDIPGDLFVIDCRRVINYNLNYVLGKKSKKRLTGWVAFLAYIFYLLIILGMFFLCFFELKFLPDSFGFVVANFNYVSRAMLFLLIIQLLAYLLPFSILAKEMPPTFVGKRKLDYIKNFKSTINFLIGVVFIIFVSELLLKLFYYFF